MSAQVPPAGERDPDWPESGETAGRADVGRPAMAERGREGPELLSELFRGLSGPRPRARPIRGARGRAVDAGRAASGAGPAAPPPGHFTEPGPDGGPEAAGGAEVESTGWAALEAAGWSMVDAVGRLAHDVRNPLTSLEVSAHVLASEVEGLGRPDLEVLVEELVAIRSRMTWGVDELVEFAHFATGALEIAKEWTRLGEVVDEALRDVRLYQSDCVVYRVSPDRQDLIAFVDGGRLRMVLRNLLRYLLDYGRPPVRVEITPLAGGFEFRVEDSDMQEGMEAVERALERIDVRLALGAPFGAGLGLFLARPVVEAHGGDLEVERAREGATAFVITLPEEDDEEIPQG